MGRAAGLALLCVLVALPARSEAGRGGFPAIEAGESVIVGPKRAARTAAERGRWRSAPGEVTLDKAHPGRVSWWMPAHQVAVFGDAFVRFRVRHEGEPKLGVMVRAQASSEDSGGMSGYVFAFDRRRLDVVRVDDGLARTLGTSAKVEALSGSGEIEGALWLIGPQMMAKLYDAKTLKELASVTTTDGRYARGSVGLRAAGGRTETALTWLSVRPAGTPSGSGPPSPAGAYRFAKPLGNAGAARILLGTEPPIVELPGRGPALMLRPVDHERLMRAGLVEAPLDIDVPGLAMHASYRKARAGGLERSPSGAYRLDLSYKDAPMVEAILRDLAARHTERARLVEIGRTRQGRTVLALRITAAPDPDAVPAILLDGAHHGVELPSIDNVLDAATTLLERAAEPEIARLLAGLTWWCVPLVNPDGNALHWETSLYGGRKNGRDTHTGEPGPDALDGVDLNRNYPFRWAALGEKGSRSEHRLDWYRGPFPASEPETQAMMRLADREHFVAAIAYHTHSTVVLAPYTIDRVSNPEPNEAWEVGKLVAAAAPRQPNKRKLTLHRKIYSVDGVAEDWYRFTHGTIALLVEGAYTNPTDPGLRVGMIEAERPTWRALGARVLDGPTVHGRVVDAGGRPVVAEIRVAEQRLKEGERWTSRCRDGRFTRVLSKPGEWTIEARLGGRVVASRTVSVEGMAEVELRLPEGQGGERGACVDPRLCSVEALCAAERGECPPSGSPVWCRIEGTCVKAGEQGSSGVCAPERDAWNWSAPAARATRGSRPQTPSSRRSSDRPSCRCPRPRRATRCSTSSGTTCGPSCRRRARRAGSSPRCRAHRP